MLRALYMFCPIKWDKTEESKKMLSDLERKGMRIRECEENFPRALAEIITSVSKTHMYGA